MPVFDHLRAYFLFMCNHQNMRPSAPHFLFACFVPENGRAGTKKRAWGCQHWRPDGKTGAEMQKRALGFKTPKQLKQGRSHKEQLSFCVSAPIFESRRPLLHLSTCGGRRSRPARAESACRAGGLGFSFRARLRRRPRPARPVNLGVGSGL
jgi:hypothetical protein